MANLASPTQRHHSAAAAAADFASTAERIWTLPSGSVKSARRVPAVRMLDSVQTDTTKTTPRALPQCFSPAERGAYRGNLSVQRRTTESQSSLPLDTHHTPARHPGVLQNLSGFVQKELRETRDRPMAYRSI